MERIDRIIIMNFFIGIVVWLFLGRCLGDQLVFLIFLTLSDRRISLDDTLIEQVIDLVIFCWLLCAHLYFKIIQMVQVSQTNDCCWILIKRAKLQIINSNLQILIPSFIINQNIKQYSMSSSNEYNSDAQVEVGDNMYVVEKILKKRTIVRHGVNEVMYFVRWEGYPRIQDHTWEPIDNLRSCPGVIQQFEKRLAAKQERSAKESQQIRRQSQKRETIAEKQKQKMVAQPVVVVSQDESSQVNSRPMKHLKKHTEINTNPSKKNISPSKKQRSQKVEKTSLHRKESHERHHKKQKHGAEPADQSQHYNEILKSYLPQKKQKKQQPSPYGKVVGHSYREGELWYEIEKLSKDKRVLRIEKMNADTASKQCMRNAYSYLQRLVKKLQKGYADRQF